MGAAIHQAKHEKLAKPTKLALAQAVGESRPTFQALCASTLRKILPTELKAHGATLPAVDIEAMAEALAHRVAKLATEPKPIKRFKAKTTPKGEWISTQEAANRCGFSRPFVAALLDSGAYKGKVNRTAGGHRKVLASEFEAMMVKASAEAQAPKTLAQARKAVDLTRLDEAEATPRTARKQSRARAQALAKKMGITA